MDYLLKIIFILLPAFSICQVATFDNVAQMQRNAAYLPTGAVVNTRGYYTIGDGGAGTYAITSGTTTANGINHNLNETSRHALFVWNGKIALEQAGAKGDGVTSDKTIFQNVAAYVATKGGGDVLGNPLRNYYLSSTSTSEAFFNIPSNTRVNGNGAKITTNGYTGVRYLFLIDGASDSSIVIENWNIYTPATDSIDRVEASTILTSNVTEVFITYSTSKNITIRNMYSEGTRGYSIRCAKAFMNNIRCKNVVGGIFIGEAASEVIVDGFFSDRSGLSGIGEADHSFYLSGGKKINISNVQIKERGSSPTGLPFSIRNDVEDITISNIVLDSCQEMAIGANKTTISNLIFSNPTGSGLFDITGSDGGEVTTGLRLIASNIVIDSHTVNFTVLKNATVAEYVKLDNIRSNGPISFRINGIKKVEITNSSFKNPFYLDADTDVLIVQDGSSSETDVVRVTNCTFETDTVYSTDHNLFYITNGRFIGKGLEVLNTSGTDLGPILYSRNSGTVGILDGIFIKGASNILDTILGGTSYAFQIEDIDALGAKGDGDKGDITVSNYGATHMINPGAVSGSAYGTVYYVPIDSIDYDATTDLATYSEIHYYMYTGAGATANQVLTIPAASISYAGKKVYVVSDDADQLDAYGLAVTSSSGATIRYYSGGDTGFSDNNSYASFGHGEGPNAVLFVCVQNPRTLDYRWVAYDGIRGGY